MVRPHLEYGNVVWNPYLKRQSVKLEKVQRRATRLLRECTGKSYGERLRYLDLHSLKGRRLRGDLINIYKMFSDTNKVYSANLLPPAPYTNTRNSERKIFIEHFRTNLRKNSLRFRTAHHWNALTIAQKFAQDTNKFKNLIDCDPKLEELFFYS